MLQIKDDVKDNRTVVRVTQSCYTTPRGVKFERSLCVLKRKSYGNCLIRDDIAEDVEDRLPLIENLFVVCPGVYELVVWDINRNWETGLPDEWTYKLIPFTEE